MRRSCQACHDGGVTCRSHSAAWLNAGFLQWKALLGLLFSCDRAATDSHPALFVLVLQTITAQLSFATSQPTDRSGESANQADATDFLGLGDSMAELLDGSFLKSQALDFLAVLLEERDRLPTQLWHQSQLLRAVLHDSLGWELGQEDDDEDGPSVVDTDLISI